MIGNRREEGSACAVLLHAFRRKQCPAKSRKYLAPLVKGSTDNVSMHSVAFPLRKDGKSSETQLR